MSPYRISGGIAAIICLALLAVVTWRWGTYTGLVQPTVSVVAAPAAGGTTARPPSNLVASEILAARTRLQGDEVNALPSSYPPLAGEESLVFQPGARTGGNIVRDWQRQGTGQGIATPRQEIFGVSSLPYTNSDVLEQPEGRDWRTLHNGPIRFGGGWLLFGVSLALALFLFGRGRVHIAEGWSVESVPRFNALERANHWMTASAFLVLALTGLVVLYGKPLLLPLIGEYGLATVARWSVWLHMGAAVPFVIGIVAMAVLWLRENLITRLDIEWLRRFGGFLHDSSDKPSAHRFNAGQKLVFWGVVLGGMAALVTGVALMFPFRWLGYDGMQWAQLIHAAVGLAMVALIIGHIYIGTVGMEGAIDAMWSGRVDRNWAREHHDLWFRRVSGDEQAQLRGARRPTNSE